MDMNKRRPFGTPTNNSYASDYISIKKAKVKFAGSSNLANNIVQQGGAFPLVTPSGELKPYQGTYGFSSATPTQGAPPSVYCLNQSHSYGDYLDITKGKYLLTPPNPTKECIQIEQLMNTTQLCCGPFFKKNNETNVVSEKIFFNNDLTGGPAGAAVAVNKIIYNPLTSANQWIYIDPTYKLFYTTCGGIISYKKKLLDNVSIIQNGNAQKEVDRFANLQLYSSMKYPSKFSLKYNPSDCINANNDIQSSILLFPKTTTIYDWGSLANGQSRTFTLSDSSMYQPGYSITITYSVTDSITGTITAISGNDITLTITSFTSATYTPIIIISTALPVTYVSGYAPMTSLAYINADTTPNPPVIPANTILTSADMFLYSGQLASLTISGISIQRGVSGNTVLPVSPPFFTPPAVSTAFTWNNGCFVGASQEVIVSVNSSVFFNTGFLPSAPDFSAYFCGSFSGYNLAYNSGVIRLNCGA